MYVWRVEVWVGLGWFCVCEVSGSSGSGSVCEWIMFVSGGPCTSLKGDPLADRTGRR